jgi:stage II sporulation protein D
MSRRVCASLVALMVSVLLDLRAQTPDVAKLSRAGSSIGQTATDISLIRVGVAQVDGSTQVRRMELEDYVAGVLAGEMAPKSASAALEALAITIRTYAVANLRRHGAEGFDLCDLTHCQVLRKATSTTSHATAATFGRILIHQGAPASVYYSASCGGHTERPSFVWTRATDPPFLPARADDVGPHESAWTAEMSAADLEGVLRAAGFRGHALRGLTIAARNDSGRVVRLHVEGFSPHEISGADFRTAVGRTLGWQHIRSTAFVVSSTARGFRFTGIGSGHGVGLCVVGSAQLAAAGRPAETILSQYFPGTQLSTLPYATARQSPVNVAR